MEIGNWLAMKSVFETKAGCVSAQHSRRDQAEGILSSRRACGGLIVLFALANGLAAAQGQEVLVDEDFSRAAKGTFLEDSPGSDWWAEEGRLIVGNERALNGQALNYAPNRTWAYQVYSKTVDSTLAPGDGVEVSFSGAVKTDVSPEFYIYALRLNDGDNYVQLQLKGGAEFPQVSVESVADGVKSQSDGEGEYYDASEDAGLAAVRMVLDDGFVQAYFDRNGDNDWIPVGEPVACQLNTVDAVLLRFYAMGFWGAVDDLKVSIVKSTP